MDFALIKEILLPEFLVLAGIIITLGLSLSSKHKYSWLVSSLVLVVSLFQLITVQLPSAIQHSAENLPKLSILFDSFVFDSLSVFFRILIYLVTLLICLGSSKYIKKLESPGEYFSILLTAALGASFLVSANDFLLLFVALETLGLSSILLTSYARKNSGSNEAGLKYLLTSAVATAMMLLGISFLYGLTADTNFGAVTARIFELSSLGALSASLQIFIAVLIVASLAFKLSAVPFHNWAPDVYSGAPTTTTLFLSVVSKTAALGLAIRLFTTVIHSDLIANIIAFAAMASIIIGNYVGVVQVINRSSVKKLLAYSSIAQAGYLMVGLAVLRQDSLSALVLYLTVYAVMNTGAFLAAIYFEQETGKGDIYDMAGLIQKKPFTTVLFSLCLINLAGLPFIPAGFIGKFFLFASSYSSDLWFGKILAVVGLLGSVVGLFYYLYVVKIMVVDSPSSTLASFTPAKRDNSSLIAVMEDNAIQVALVASVALMTYIGIFNTSFFQRLSDYVIRGIG